MAWNGFEIVCIGLKDEGEFGDQRNIAEVGILAPTLTMKSIEVAWSIQTEKEDRPYVHVDVDGTPTVPTPDKVDGVRFLRLADELSSSDPILNLPECESYQRDERLASVT